MKTTLTIITTTYDLTSKSSHNCGTSTTNLAQLILPLDIVFLLLSLKLFEFSLLLLLQLSATPRLHCGRCLLQTFAVLGVALGQRVQFTDLTSEQSIKFTIYLLPMFIHLGTTFALQLNTLLNNSLHFYHAKNFIVYTKPNTQTLRAH